MPGAFDPYHTWLGIPPEEQPPDYYRLLGVRTFEDKPEAIEHAADQRMAHLRNLQTGKHAAASQKVLNEVAAARVCLLNREKKAAYDRMLREKMQAAAARQTAEVPSQASVVDALAEQIHRDQARKASSQGGGKKVAANPGLQRPVIYAGAGAAAIVLLGIAAWAFWPRGEKRAEPQTAQVAPTRVAQPHLTLNWPVADRKAAVLEIDGEKVAIQEDGPRMKLPLAEGRHQLRITREGFEPFTQAVELASGENAVVEPQWRAAKAAVPESAVAQTDPQPTKLPAPAEEMQKEVAKEEATQGNEKAIAAAEAPSTPAKEPSETSGQAEADAKRQSEAAAKAEESGRRDAEYVKATKTAEESAAAWDFKRADEALAEVRFGDASLSARLAQRRDEIQRMGAMKERLIAAVNEADPSISKTTLMLRGAGGTVVEATEKGLIARLKSGEKEGHPWKSLGGKTLKKLLARTAERDNADDSLASALLAMQAGDIPLAESCFEQAGALGAKIEPYLTPLAAAAFGEAQKLVEEKHFARAHESLTSLEKKYSDSPWFASNKTAVQSLQDTAKRGELETEAEKLYVEAVEHFNAKDYYDVKPLVDKLKAEYSDTAPVTDSKRMPPFADLEKATADLGRRFVIRQKGKADFTSIQAAVDAAPANSYLEIQDSGPYNEQVTIAKGGLTIAGKRGCWPIITCNRVQAEGSIIEVRDRGTVLKRLVVVSRDKRLNVLGLYAAPTTVQLTILDGGETRSVHGRSAGEPQKPKILDTLFLSQLCTNNNPLEIQNCIVLRGDPNLVNSSELRNCTILTEPYLWNSSHRIFDSIMKNARIDPKTPSQTIESCIFFKPGFPAVAKGCVTADPRFRDPTNLDLRLQPGSPCIGKASDGGDIGCRYTADLLELCKVAMELRARGVVKF